MIFTELLQSTDPETQIEKLSNELHKMAENMEVFSLTMLSLFHDRNIIGRTNEERQFMALRDLTKNEAVDFRYNVLPKTRALVTNIQRFFEYYKYLEFEEWKECLDDVSKDLETNKNDSKELVETQTNLSARLKRSSDKARQLCGEFDHKEAEYAEEIKSLKLTAAAKIGGFGALGSLPSAVAILGATPVVLGVVTVAALPAALYLGFKALEDLGKKRDTEKEKKAIYFLSHTVKTDLIPMIDNFSRAVDTIAGYFEGLQCHLNNAGVGNSKPMFLIGKRKATEIIDECQMFLRVIPAIESNLQAIGN